MADRIQLTWKEQLGIAFGAAAGLGMAAAALFEQHDPDNHSHLGEPGKAHLATPAELDHLDQDLRAVGVVNFTARELLKNRKRGRTVYYMPPPELIGNLLAMAQRAQRTRDLWGGPLIVSSAYRPQDGRKSAHHYAKAIDLDLPKHQRTYANRRRLYLLAAAEYLDTHYGGLGLYRWPLGRLHVDVARPRYWTTARGRKYFAMVKSGAEPGPMLPPFRA